MTKDRVTCTISHQLCYDRTIKKGLNKLFGTTRTNKMYFLFQPHHLRTNKVNAPGSSRLKIGDLHGSLPTKHVMEQKQAEKALC